MLEKFQNYFEPKKFQNRQQQLGETVAEYVTALREIRRNYEFGKIEERMLVVQISNGVKDDDLRKRLWDDDLSLTETIKKCHIYEQWKDNKALFEWSNVNYF